MGTSSIDPAAVCDRGAQDPESLDPDELVVFALIQLETLADMEGWDHFFTCESFRLYGVLTAAFAAAGDERSLEIMRSYESYFRFRRVPFTPESIDTFLCSSSEHELQSAPDWRAEFSAASDQRWAKLRAWMRLRGRELVV